jgi:hypothetical protein
MRSTAGGTTLSCNNEMIWRRELHSFCHSGRRPLYTHPSLVTSAARRTRRHCPTCSPQLCESACPPWLSCSWAWICSCAEALDHTHTHTHTRHTHFRRNAPDALVVGAHGDLVFRRRTPLCFGEAVVFFLVLLGVQLRLATAREPLARSTAHAHARTAHAHTAHART